jgi:hypothetical protein
MHRPASMKLQPDGQFTLPLGVELATLEDAARFMGHMRPRRQARPHWDCAADLVLIAATTGEEADIERATAQMERAPA